MTFPLQMSLNVKCHKFHDDDDDDDDGDDDDELILWYYRPTKGD